MKLNSKHYTGLSGLFGANFLDFLSKKVLPIHFNPFIKINDDISIKYGVIETRALIKDLNSWNSLICSGRLHKPVKFLL